MIQILSKEQQHDHYCYGRNNRKNAGSRSAFSGHCRTGEGTTNSKRTEETARNICQALTHQLFTGVDTLTRRTGNRLRNRGGFHKADQSHNQCCRQQCQNKLQLYCWHLKFRQAFRHNTHYCAARGQHDLSIFCFVKAPHFICSCIT